MSLSPDNLEGLAADFSELAMGSKEAPKEAFDIRKESNFIQACYQGDVKYIDELLKKDPYLVRQPATNGQTPIAIVTDSPEVPRGKKADIIQKLLNKYDEISKESAFIKACLSGGEKDVRFIREALKKDPSLANEPALDGRTPLMCAAQGGLIAEKGREKEEGHLAIVRLLLQYKAKIDEVHDAESALYRGVTPMWYAANYHRWDIVQELVKNGARNLDACPIGGKTKEGKRFISDRHGQPILWLARSHEQEQIATLLLSKGARDVEEIPLSQAPSVFERVKFKGQS